MMLPGVRILRNQGGAGGSGSGGDANGGNPGGSAGGGEGGAAGGDQGSASGGAGGGNDIANLPPWAQEHIKSLRTESAGYRTRATKAEDDLKTKTDAELSEVERLKKQNGELEAKLSAMTVTQKNAAKVNILRDADAMRPNLLVGEIPDDIFGEDGEPDEGKVKKLVDRLRQTYPEQFKRLGSANGGAGAGSGADGATDMNDWLRSQRR